MSSNSFIHNLFPYKYLYIYIYIYIYSYMRTKQESYAQF